MKYKVIVLGVAALFAILIVLRLCLSYGTVDYVTATVAKTERVTTGSGDSISSKYLVFTKDETFENRDTLLFMKFNSSDLYGEMESGQTYRLKVNGFRVPFLSWYRNIIEAEPR